MFIYCGITVAPYLILVVFLMFIVSEIERKEARVNAMRAAILETFPEPNRRLLQRCVCVCVCLCACM